MAGAAQAKGADMLQHLLLLVPTTPACRENITELTAWKGADLSAILLGALYGVLVQLRING